MAKLRTKIDMIHGPRKAKRRVCKFIIFSELEMRNSIQTHDSGSWNRGSNPCFPATLIRVTDSNHTSFQNNTIKQSIL